MKNDNKMLGAVAFLIFAFAVLFVSMQATKMASNDLPLIPVGADSLERDVPLADSHTGRKLHLSDITGKTPVVMSFWATWCAPCRMELPEIQELSQRYKGRVAFYAISSSDPPHLAAKFFDKQGFTFPVLSDPGYTAAHAYEARTLPQVVVIDSTRHVRVLSAGYSPETSKLLAGALDRILAGA